MLYKLQSNIFILLSTYVVRKYNSTLKGFTVLPTLRSLCSHFGLPSCCPLANWKTILLSFMLSNSLMCITAPNKHSGDCQAFCLFVCLLFYFYLNVLEILCPTRVFEQMHSNITCERFELHIHVCSNFLFDYCSHMVLKFEFETV